PASIGSNGAVDAGGLRLPLVVRTGARQGTIGVRPDGPPLPPQVAACWRGKNARNEHAGPDLLLHGGICDFAAPAIVRVAPSGKTVGPVDAEIVLQPVTERTLLFDESGSRVAAIAEIHQVPAFA